MILHADKGRSFQKFMQPWQERDFAALDLAWCSLAKRSSAGSGDSPSRVPYRRSYIERPRGHSKTSDMAMQIAWILLAAKEPVTGLAAAADRDQANLIYRAIRRLAELNPDQCDQLVFVQHLVRNSLTGSQLEVISSDVRSSWGALPDFVVCDELCHWERPDLWYSLLSSAAKKPTCVLSVLTNAGVGRGWQWDVREHAKENDAWYFSSLDGPHAPWITDEWLTEQRALLPAPVFERLWLNEWQHSDGEFVSLAEAEACRDQQLKRQECGTRGIRYVAAIDYAEKRDFTVGCVCHYDGSRIVVDRMDVVKPSPTHPTSVRWVEAWIEDVAASFPDVEFVIDEHQLVGTIQNLERCFNVRRFDFAAGKGNHRLAMRLRQLIVHQQVAWYAGCGDVSDAGNPQRDDLETELASLLLKQSETGRLRIDHHRDGVHHDDRAFTLGAACLELSEHSTEPDHFSVTLPGIDGGFCW
ncbi:MAG: terminase [Planctomycetaceae bacterium]|nr:terminase [Planctomycetaceae bacterium]